MLVFRAALPASRLQRVRLERSVEPVVMSTAPSSTGIRSLKSLVQALALHTMMVAA